MSDARSAMPSSRPPEPRRRRWYQFGLRALFLLMTIIIGLLVAWRTYVEPYRQQREAMALIKRLGGAFETGEAAAWQRRLFGDDFQNLTAVDLASSDKVEEYLPHIARLPCLEKLTVGGLEFGDEHLRRLHLPTLRSVELDSTLVSDDVLSAWLSESPQVQASRTESRAIAALLAGGFTVDSPLKSAPSALSGDPWGPFERWAPRSAVSSAVSIFGGRQAEQGVWRWFLTLRELKELWLTEATIDDDGVACLSRLKQLEFLDLCGTQVGDAGLEHLSGLTRLRGLLLNRTRVTTEGKCRLQEAIPQCVINGQ